MSAIRKNEINLNSFSLFESERNIPSLRLGKFYNRGGVSPVTHQSGSVLMDSFHVRHLLWLYCRIRFAQYILQFIANTLLPDHDAHVFNPPLWNLSNNASCLDWFIDRIFSGFRRWDAIYFLHIARFGYIYENSLAFFPTYPMIVIRPIAYIFRFFLAESNAFLFGSLIGNFLIGMANTCLLFRLALRYNLKTNIAYWSSIIYMFNPATVFFIAPYSESLFLFTQLLALLSLTDHRPMIAAFFFGIGSSVRANGIVSVGFLLHYWLCNFRQRWPPVHHIALALAPFFLVQYYQYLQFCFPLKNTSRIPSELLDYADDYNLRIPFASSWCFARFPLPYQYIQSHYWHVGLFNYWTWKQLPNFLLALPVFLLVTNLIRQWYRSNREQLLRHPLDVFFLKSTEKNSHPPLASSHFIPHIVYILFLSLFALVLMHVQVATRFLFSSGPLLYFYCAIKMNQPLSNRRLSNIFFQMFTTRKYFFIYCMTYVVVGIGLFSNFLPWT